MKQKITNILLITIVMISAIFLGCNDTRVNGVDLDFEAKLTTSNTRSYVGKPNKVGIDVRLLDANNEYKMVTTFIFTSGEIKIDGVKIESAQPLYLDYKGTLWFEYIPAEFDVAKVDISIKNDLVERQIVYETECDKSFFDVNLQDVPDKILIDTKADFKLLLSEMESTGNEKVNTYAKVLKGKGIIYTGETVLNPNEETETETDKLNQNEEDRSSKSTIKRVPLNVGTNNMSYYGSEEGENIIRLYMTNEWGYEVTKDVHLMVNLPDWELTNSMGEEAVEIPYNDKFSFNLSVDEEDIFKDNSYTGVFRILSNSDIKIFINDKEYNQGSEFKLKSGGNVGVIVANDATEGSVEFIVKDKYKQEKKNEIKFVSKLPIKPIEASLDKSSQSVKINQVALFKLSLKEVNYSDVFSVKYEVLSGAGTFEGGLEHSLSEGTHDVKFTPTVQGASTYRITIKDTNEQEKTLNATVQASLSPLSVTLSEMDVNLIQGQTKSLMLNVSEPDYVGKYFFSYKTPDAETLVVNGTNIGVGGVVEFTNNQIPIIVSASKLGTVNYTITVIDEYKQSKDVVLKSTIKGEVKVSASTGGTVTGGGTFSLNQNTTLVAKPSVGNQFKGWYRGSSEVSTNATYIFPVTESIELTAQFSKSDYTVGVSAETGGTATGGGSFKHGDIITLKATVLNGYEFLGWFDGVTNVSSTLEYKITVVNNKTYIAKFAAKSYTVTINSETGGTATGGGTYKYDSRVTVKAIVDKGYNFGGWFINGKSVSGVLEYNFTIKEETLIEARFLANDYGLTVNAETGGTATGGTVTGAGQYEFGKTATLTALPSANYTFKNWTEDGTPVSTNATLTFTVSKDRELVANFTGNKFNVTANAQAGGTATGGGSYEFGSKAKVTATVDANYTFAGWHDGTKIISTSLSYEFTVSANITLEAQFTAGKFNVTVNAGTGGTATGSGSYNFNSNVTVKATPDANHTFKGWSDGTKTVSTSAEYTFILKSSTTLSAEFTAKKYQLTVNAGTGGTATGAGSFDYGTKATVTATASTGFGFDGWYIGTTKASSSLVYQITIDKAITVEARFTANKFNVTASASTGGTVTGAGQYEFGKTATLTALPSANYTFKNWTEDGTPVSTNATLTFTVSKDRELVANFTGNKFNVTANAQAGGTATGSGSFAFGSKAKVTATVDANYTFAGWHDGTKIISTSLSYEFTVSANITLEAQFTAGKFNVTVNAGTGGTATGSGSYNFNSNVTVKATPDANHTFKGWSDGTKTVSTSAEYTFILKSSTTLSAEFTAKKYQLTVNAGTGGTATGAGSFDYGTKATVTATASTGFGFDGWYIGATKVSTTASYQITIDKAITVEARFTANKFNISVSAETGGTATGGGSIAYGTNATLTATPIANYTFVGWYEGVNQVSPNATYTFSVDKARTLVAKFKGNPFNVTANAQTGGTATGSGSFAFGSKAKVTATVDANYTFTGWFEGSTNVSNSLSYEFTVTKATTLEARFVAKKYNVTVNALAGGTATGSGSFDYNSNVTVKAVLGTGHTFGGWYNGATKVSSSLDYTFVLKTAIVLEARFVANTHSIVVNAGTGGTATGGGSYKYGVNATLTATVGAGHKFLGWYVGSSSVATTASYTFKVEKDLNVEARFEANKFNIVANAEVGGTATGGGSIAYGTNTTLKATANANYQFDGWYEGATRVSTNLSYTFVVDKARTLVAKFIINKHKITVTGTNGVQAGGGDYNYGVNATVTATANANYKFLGWYIGTTLASSTASYIFKVEKDLILEAKYELLKYVISASATAGGTATGGATYNHGASVSLVATPSTGYKFLGWYEGATQVSTNLTYTFNADKARTLQARFELLKYVIGVSATAGGTATGGATYNHGASVSLVATPNTGYKFLGWYEGATQVSTNATYTFTTDKARTLQARFEILKYVIGVSATAGGTATGGATYNHGASVSLVATPNTGYKFLGWYEGATSVSTSLTYTFSADKARTLQARFEIIQYILEIFMYQENKGFNIAYMNAFVTYEMYRKDDPTKTKVTLSGDESISFNFKSDYKYFWLGGQLDNNSTQGVLFNKSANQVKVGPWIKDANGDMVFGAIVDLTNTQIESLSVSSPKIIVMRTLKVYRRDTPTSSSTLYKTFNF